MVELTAEDESGEDVTHALVSLTVGGTEQVYMCIYTNSGASVIRHE